MRDADIIPFSDNDLCSDCGAALDGSEPHAPDCATRKPALLRWYVLDGPVGGIVSIGPNSDHPVADAHVEHAPLLAAAPELKEIAGQALDWMELSHYKCDLNSDVECYAEQYGDGDKSQHKFLRDANKLLASLGGGSV